MAWGRVICMLKCNTVYLATDNFMHPQLARRLALGTQKLERARKIWNINGTNNKAGRITEYVDLNVFMERNKLKCDSLSQIWDMKI